ncbi:MOSC domain-containing protein [Angustibacter speluncae]
MPDARVLAVSSDGEHRFSKVVRPVVELVEGLGVRGDAHLGETVRHRSRVRRDPTVPNLRQVHLVAREFLDEAREAGFEVGPGELGENVLTEGLDLLRLPRGTRLRLGPDAVVRVTGLRNPCVQIDRFRPGLLKVAVRPGPDGPDLRAGVMSVVETGGEVRAGDGVTVELPDGPHVRLEVV